MKGILQKAFDWLYSVSKIFGVILILGVFYRVIFTGNYDSGYLARVTGILMFFGFVIFTKYWWTKDDSG